VEVGGCLSVFRHGGATTGSKHHKAVLGHLPATNARLGRGEISFGRVGPSRTCPKWLAAARHLERGGKMPSIRSNRCKGASQHERRS